MSIDRSAEVCAICGSRTVRGRLRGIESFVDCEGCGALLKLLTRSAYAALSPTYDPGPAFHSPTEAERRQELGVEAKVQFISELALPPRRRGRMLDIGCGAGGYLLAARELGFEVQGVEPSVEHSRLAREVLHLPVRTDYFRAKDFEPASLDLVILSHVIEHIYEPKQFLEEAFSVVAPGGTLVVVTPNAGAWVTRLSGMSWVMLKTFDHVTMLSPESFVAMGVQTWGEYRARTSEYPWEPAAVLAASLRDALVPRRAAMPSTSGTVRAGRPGLSAAITRAALTMASLPLHFGARVANAQACLVVEVQKR